MAQPEEQRVLKIPLPVFESAETKEELEDWLLAHDSQFLKEMQRIKEEESGNGVSLEEAAKQWRIKS